MTIFACAALLTSVVALTGCKGDQNEPQQNGPSVTTDIAISLPEQAIGGPAAKRMPGNTVQTSASQFNGMKNITLIPFAKSAAVTGASVRLGDNISLGDIAADGLYANSNSKVYTGKQVPIATSAFLFYGESKVSGELHNTGYLEATSITSNNPSAFEFQLKPIITNLSEVTDDAKYKGLINYLNHVAAATPSGSGAKAWRDTIGEWKELFDIYATTRNLNSFGIQRMMHDLYKSLKNNPDLMAKAICDSIKDGVYAALNAAGDSVKLNAAYQDFPSNLPVGAVSVSYNTTDKKFEGSATKEWKASNDASVSLNVAPVQLYTYPSSLWYYANTRIKTSESLQEPNYDGKANWDAVLALYAKDNASVTTKTRSLALKDQIQYAVARLDVKIAASSNTLVDNNPVEANRNIANADAYLLTGVLVGGQKNVGFDFTPKGATSYTIYDKSMGSTIKANTDAYSAANSTLVLETAANADVMIAIELLNNSGKDFYGADGVVPAGGRFYLVGKLPASEATTTDNKVFKQDYTTTAQLLISSLQKAYNTIPDLREPTLEIGLSVDLEWSTGTTYSISL